MADLDAPPARSSGGSTAALLFSGNVLGYLDRAAFAIAAPLIAAELALSPVQMGWLLSAFFMGYIFVSYAGGVAADRFGAGRVITLAAVIWSVFCALTAAPVGFWLLMAIRILFGAGEGPYTPAVNKIVAATTSPQRYSGTLAFVSTGQPLGGLIAGPAIGGLALLYGWRAPFLAVAALGIFWAAVWTWYVRVHPQPAFLGSRRTNEALQPGLFRLLGRCLTTPAVCAIAFAYFGFAFVLYFFLSWFPSYLISGLGVSMRDMSGATAIPWAVGLAGLLLGGMIVNRMQRTPWGAVHGRKALLSGGLAVAGIAVGATGLVDSAVMAVGLMSLAAFCIYLTGVCYLGLLRELVDRRHLGSVGGFVIAGSSLAGIVAPAATGAIVQATGGYGAAFLLAGGVSLAGAIAVDRLVTEQQLEMVDADD